MKKALIIGSKGQDGQLLTAHLTKQNYLVLGVARNKTECSDQTSWEPVDILNQSAVTSLIKKFQPDEIYYVAAFHHSSQNKELVDPSVLWSKSFEVNVSGLVNVLEAIRTSGTPIKLFYASSCLVYGDTTTTPQTELTPFSPNDIYGITKMTGVQICRYYRKQYHIFAAAGILYNHESALRPERFVSQKIIQGALRIKRGESDSLQLGNLSAEIDWGYAPNYVEAMHRILQLETPDDFIIATGITHTVRDFVVNTFAKLGLDWTRFVKEDKTIIQRGRGKLQGDPTKLQQLTGWQPTVSFEQMINYMLDGVS